jgi:hypothetical protein
MLGQDETAKLIPRLERAIPKRAAAASVRRMVKQNRFDKKAPPRLARGGAFADSKLCGNPLLAR